MSQYNKTVLTQAGIDLARRANAGQAKFKITRAVTSADDLSGTPVEQLERMTEIPNIMQSGKIAEAEEVESDNAMIGVSLRFTNKDLTNGYKIRIIGVYVQEDGQANDFLYALSTAVEPEYMPDFSNQVLYRFNLQMYLVIGRVQNVSVMIDDANVVTVKNFADYQKQIQDKFDASDKELKGLKDSFTSFEGQYQKDQANASKIKNITINGGSPIVPSDQGVVNIDVPKPDLSKYPTKDEVAKSISSSGMVKSVAGTKPDANGDANPSQKVLVNYDVAAQKQTFENRTIGNYSPIDQNVANVLSGAINTINTSRLPVNKGADGEDVFSYYSNQIRTYDGQKNIKNVPADCAYKDNHCGTYVYLMDQSSHDGTLIFISPENKIWLAKSNSASNHTWSNWSRIAMSSELNVLQNTLQNSINTKADKATTYSKTDVNNILKPINDEITKLKGLSGTYDKPNFNSLTDTGVYYISSPDGGQNYPVGSWGSLAVFNGKGARIEQVYFPGSNAAPFIRQSVSGTWKPWIELAQTSDVTNLRTTLQNAINTKANQTDLTSLDKRVGTNEGKISDHEARIQKLEQKKYAQFKHFTNEAEAKAWNAEDPYYNIAIMDD